MFSLPLMIPSEAEAIAALTEEQVVSSLQKIINSDIEALFKLTLIENQIKVFFYAKKQVNSKRPDPWS